MTLADKAAERAIRDEIQRVYPRRGILGEEHGGKAGTDGLTWIIDPIDGTRAFIIGQLHWGVLIALNDGERPVVGVMHQPYTGETFVGSRLGAEFRRGSSSTPLKVREWPASRRCDRLGRRSRDVHRPRRTRRVSRGRCQSPDAPLQRRLLFVLHGCCRLHRSGHRIGPEALRHPTAHPDHRVRRRPCDKLVRAGYTAMTAAKSSPLAITICTKSP